MILSPFDAHGDEVGGLPGKEYQRLQCRLELAALSFDEVLYKPREVIGQP